MTRRTWAVAILGAWAASLGWLVKRELFRPTGTRLAEAALSVPPGAVYYRLDVAGQQVGFASSTIDTQPTSIGVVDLLVLRVPALGVLHRTAAMSRATLSRTLRLERVDARFDGEIGRFAAHNAINGDTALVATVLTGTDSQTAHIPLAGPIVLPSLLPLRLAFGGQLARGKTYTTTVFDPVLLAQRPVTVTVAAESTFVVADSAAYDSTALAWVPARFDTVRAFRVDQREAEGAMTTRAWIDAQGHIVRAENPVGFVMERTAFELAYTNFRNRDTTGLIRASTSPGPGAIVATTALGARATLRRDTLSLLRVRVTGVAPGALDLAGGRQQQRGDTLVIRRETGVALAARYRLPARDSGTVRWLAPAPLIQSTDPRVQVQARLIVGGGADPARAARAIAAWVHGHVDRQANPGVPSAAHALAAARGDCNEHAVLYVALARAVGLPARTVAGLVYLNGRFYYHAWAEVYLGDWVAVDPMLDEFPAGAAHVRFSIGGLARQAELVRLIGRIKLEVL
jgi:transglutaminase superfamily protein